MQALGGQAVFLSAVGSDREGDVLREALARQGISDEHVLEVRSRRTLARHRMVVGDQLLLRFDQGDTISS